MNGRLMRAAVLLGTVSIAPGAHGGRFPIVERTALDNGLVLLVVPQPELPMVVASAIVKAGSRLDPLGREGLASLTASLLTEGAGKWSAAEIHDLVDFLGIRLGGAAGDEYATVTLTVLKKDLERGMELFADLLRRPTFPEKEFARKREEALGDLEAADQDPGSVASREFRKALFRNGPYRHPSGGWTESVRALAVEDVREFYRASFKPDRTILVAAGDVTKKEVASLVERLLGGWRGDQSRIGAPEPAPRDQRTVVRVERDLTQANIVWGHIGTTREDPEWYALQVMNYILGGGGFSSRMMSSIRTEAGLAYSVFSYFSGGKLPGSFQVVLQTKSASTAEALSRLEREIDRIRSEPVSDEELSGAKKYLTGSFPMRFDTNTDLVAFYSQVEFFGLGLDYPERHDSLIEAVSKEDVLRVSKKYLRPADAILIVVGRQSDIEIGRSRRRRR